MIARPEDWRERPYHWWEARRGYFRLGRLFVERSRLPTNSHGRAPDGYRSTLSWTARVVQLGAGYTERTCWGARLWIYGPGGRCWSLGAGWIDYLHPSRRAR